MRTPLRALVAAMALAACRDFTDPPIPKGLDKLNVLPDTLLADGVSTAMVSAIIDTTTADTLRSVVFVTTMGGFLPSGAVGDTAIGDSSGHASALLRAPRDTGSTMLTASFENKSISKLVYFTFAPPQSMQMTPTGYIVVGNSTSPITITVVLRRFVGFPTTGIPVAVTARDPADTARGHVSNPGPTDSTGTVTVVFGADSSYIGPVWIRAAAPAAVDSLRDSLSIEIR